MTHLCARANDGPVEAARPRPGAGDLVAHLPDVLLVVEDLLLPTPRAVLHVGQGANSACCFDLQFFMMNLYQIIKIRIP